MRWVALAVAVSPCKRTQEPTKKRPQRRAQAPAGGAAPAAAPTGASAPLMASSPEPATTQLEEGRGGALEQRDSGEGGVGGSGRRDGPAPASQEPAPLAAMAPAVVGAPEPGEADVAVEPAGGPSGAGRATGEAAGPGREQPVGAASGAEPGQPGGSGRQPTQAQQASQQLAAQWRPRLQGQVAVRLSLEEAFFLHHVLGCLAVYTPAPGQGPGHAGPALGPAAVGAAAVGAAGSSGLGLAAAAAGPGGAGRSALGGSQRADEARAQLLRELGLAELDDRVRGNGAGRGHPRPRAAELHKLPPIRRTVPLWRALPSERLSTAGRVPPPPPCSPCRCALHHRRCGRRCRACVPTL
jgi:DNA polymerase-3 subunit gamma/tau